MAKFTPQTVAPKKTDRHYYSNENIYFKEGHGMPNCTAFAFGRLYSLTDKIPSALAGQPEVWFSLAQKNGMKTGQTPKLGAIACWKKGAVNNSKDGTGHVNTVEKIYDNGDFDSANSQYNGKEFFMQRITKASGYKYADGFDFLGFIYCGIEFEDEKVELNNKSYPNYTEGGKGYQVNLKFNDWNTSKGVYNLWQNAYNQWKKYEKDGYHVYDAYGKQLDTNTTTSVQSSSATTVTATKLTDKSYPDYTGLKYYYVQKKFKNWLQSKGIFRKWKGAFDTWNKHKDKGYHIYDNNGKQLD